VFSNLMYTVSYICHELRNPLHGLLGALEALTEGALSLVSRFNCCVPRCRR
jgi:signal transduction histidine kinase